MEILESKDQKLSSLQNKLLDKNEAEKIIKAENEKNLEVQKKTSKALSPNETKIKSKKKENKAPVKKKAKKVSKK